MLTIHYFFTFVLALGFALYITPMVMKAALHMNIVAKPDGILRTQEAPVPYLGGVAIYLSLLFVLVMGVDFTPKILGLLFGTAIVLMVGLIDDFGVMTARMKLFGQVVAVVALIKGGIAMELAILDLRWPFDLPFLLWGLTLLWGVALANALNFLDIEDGLAGGVAASVCPGLFVVAVLNGRPEAAIFTAALFGSIIGFLRYNLPLPRARIYLGDAGSLFLGVSLAALAMIGSYTGKNDIAAVCPLLILGVPAFEIFTTIAARLRKGKPIWHGSPDHIAKRLQKAGLSKRKTLALHIGTSLVLGGVAIAIMNTEILAASIMVGVVGLIAVAAFILLLRIDVDKPVAEKGTEKE